MRVRRGSGNEPLQGSRAEIDAIGKGMLAIGGSIAVVAVPLVALAGVAFVYLLSLGFADDPGRVAAEEQLTMLLVVGVVGAIVVALILLLRRALRGGTLALVGTTVVGGGLTWFVVRTWEAWGSGTERPGDRAFLLQLAALCVPPVLMTLGSALRLLARVRPGITLPDDLD